MNLPNWITGNEKPPDRVVEYVEGFMKFFAGLASLPVQQSNMPDIFTGTAIKMVKELEFMYEGAPSAEELDQSQFNELVGKISQSLRVWADNGWIQVPAEGSKKEDSPSQSFQEQYQQVLQQALANLQARNYVQALPLFHEVLLMDRNDIVARYGAGYCCFYLQDYGEAEIHFLQVLRLNPKNPMEQTCKEVSMFKYGQTLRRLGKLSNAISILKSVFEGTPSDYAHVQELVIALNNNKQYSEALKVLREARKYQTHPEILQHMDTLEKANKQRLEIDIR